MDRIRRRKTTGVLAVLVALLVGMTGCGSDSPDSGGRTGASPAANPTDIAREASEFAGIVIPANATVLDAETEGGLDTLYRLVVLTDPEGLDLLLAESKFSTPLTEASSVTETTIAGPPLETSPAVRKAADIYRNAAGKSVNRKIIVDERDPSTRFVHLQLFDT